LNIDDEYAHAPNERPDWRESYYFNWVDLDTGISGFSTIGLLPNVNKREFVFALFYEDKREVHFNESEGPFTNDFANSLTDGVLTYELVEPLKEWKITYDGKKVKFKMTWPARFPAYDFGIGSGTSWAGHFEQSGSPDGIIEFVGGRKIHFSGLGERDKSWGSRDWHIENWYALHAQFDDISIGLRRDMVKGEVHISGSISTLTGHEPLKHVDLVTEKHPESKIPIGAKTRVAGIDRSIYNIESQLISPTSFVRFERKFSGGRTELYEGMAVHRCKELGKTGTGLIEWLFTYR